MSNKLLASLVVAISLGAFADNSVDLAGLPRLNHDIDVGCYEKQPVAGTKIFVR